MERDRARASLTILSDRSQVKEEQTAEGADGRLADGDLQAEDSELEDAGGDAVTKPTTERADGQVLDSAVVVELAGR